MAGMEGFTRLPSSETGQTTSAKLDMEFMSQRIRYQGVFDLNELYKIIYDWLISKGFQVHESTYKSIPLPSGGKERSFNWNAHKKGEEFVMAWIFIHFQIQDLHEIEVEENGEKKKLTKGRLFIRVFHDIEMDFSGRFASKTLHQKILKFLVEYMWAKKVETFWEDKTRFKAYELVNVIKETLDFMTKGNEHYDVW